MKKSRATVLLSDIRLLVKHRYTMICSGVCSGLDGRDEAVIIKTPLRQHSQTKWVVDQLCHEAAISRRLAGVTGVPQVKQFFWLRDESGQRRPVLVLEKIDGSTLHQLRKTKPQFLLPMAEAAAVLRAIGQVLLGIHQRGIIHGDLKLGNIMVQPNGTVAILDWGTAVELATQQPPPGPVIGTMQFISYEQIMKQRLDQRTDIYALGMVLGLLTYGDAVTPRYYYDKTGAVVERSTAAIASAVTNKETLKYDRLPQPQTAAERQWQNLLRQMTQWDYRQRPASVGVCASIIRNL